MAGTWPAHTWIPGDHGNDTNLNNFVSANLEDLKQHTHDGADGHGASSIVPTEVTVSDRITLSTAELLQAKGANVASASALPIGSDGNYFSVTGTTTINTIATKQAGTVIWLHFQSGLTVAHSANLILQGGASAIVTAGMVMQFVSEGGGVWREVSRHSLNAPVMKRKTADQTVSSPAAVSCNHLSFTLLAGEYWAFEGVIFFDNTTLEIGMLGATYLWASGPDPGTPANAKTSETGGNLQFGARSPRSGLKLSGIAAGAGTLVVRYAAPLSADCHILTDSFLVLTKLQ